MPVILAKTAGFCFGVSRAVDLAKAAAPCYTLGPLIHNRHAVAELEAAGVYALGSLDTLPAGATLVIRSHGAPPELYETLQSQGIRYIDATCPLVSRIHRLVSERTERMILLIGDKSHPEVVASAAWCKSAQIIQNLDELQAFFGQYDGKTPITVVQQSTCSVDECERCKEFFKKQCTNGEFLDTICPATVERQSEAKTLSAQTDVMVVVGDPQSANTRSLAAACQGEVYTVEDAGMLSLYPWRNKVCIGLTAGASTPHSRIKEVLLTMSDEQNMTIGEVISQDNESSVADNKQGMESFAELLEQSLKTLNSGDKVTGLITAVTPTEVSVDLGTKHAAYIPLSELTDDPSLKADELVKVGDEIETYVVRVNDAEGTVMLSKRRVDTAKSWENVEDARETGVTMEGIVLEDNKGGVVVSVKGVRVFVPASQTGLPKDTPMSEMIRRKVKLKITEFNRQKKRVVGSIRVAVQEERRAAAEALWSNIEVGRSYDGVVKSLTAYGAFVDIGGVDGLVHMTELSWNRIKSPSDVVKVGDKLAVRVLSVDKEKNRISLGCRKPEDNPWNRFVETHNVGDVLNVRIVKLMPFGAFAEVMPGVDGLIHISQLSDHRVVRPSDAVNEGDMVDVKITEIDTNRQKISLSIRALLEEGGGGNDNSGPDEIVATSGEEGTAIAGDLLEDNAE